MINPKAKAAWQMLTGMDVTSYRQENEAEKALEVISKQDNPLVIKTCLMYEAAKAKGALSGDFMFRYKGGEYRLYDTLRVVRNYEEMGISFIQSLATYHYPSKLSILHYPPSPSIWREIHGMVENLMLVPLTIS
jgi:hypothetical protein